MTAPALAQLLSALAGFASETRLYELDWLRKEPPVARGSLVVEAFAADEELLEAGYRDVFVLSTDKRLSARDLLHRQASLWISLANGERAGFSGYVSEVDALGNEGRLTRYRLRLTPWVWRLGQVRNNRIWQNKRVTDIVDDVFARHRPYARWRWSEEVWDFIGQAITRRHCCQYRESDLAFVQRLLGEEGLGWRMEELADGHGLVLFADSRRTCAVPRDSSCAAGNGVRYHAAHAGEQHDSVQSASLERRLIPASCTLLSYDEHDKRSYTARHRFRSTDDAWRYAQLQMQSHAARAWSWTMRSTVRTFRPGTRFTLTNAYFKRFGDPAVTITRVRSIGINKLPDAAAAAIAAMLGPVHTLLAQALQGCDPIERDLAIAQAGAGGYANLIEGLNADLPWRPMPADSRRQRLSAHGSQSAMVVGADGSTRNPGDIHCDALGRVRIRFHWQGADDDATCWVRVTQRSAGHRMGSQFLPRIGQEVLVQFMENDIDRPVIVGALYNGLGEGGVLPTPGGKQVSQADASVFASADDHCRSAQGKLVGGSSPAWHGASPGHQGHRNAAAQWGIFSKELGVPSGSAGYKQLLFDDTDGQGRVQLKCTHAGTGLNLGHLIHTADNYRGSLRGTGAELRTDDYGSVRAGDNVAAVSLLKQAVQLATSFDDAAGIHKTVGLACVMRSEGAANDLPPLTALQRAVSGMVSTHGPDAAMADAAANETGPAQDRIPHLADPLIAISAAAGLGLTAAQDLQLATGDSTGAASSDYPLPELPRSELPKRELKFKMRLADTPGPIGHRLAHTPWKIAFGDKPLGMPALDDDKIVAQGDTDEQGNIVLTPAREEALADAYRRNPDRARIVYPGHAARLAVQTESPDWTEEQKLMQAMNAADFSHGLQRSRPSEGAQAQVSYAKSAFEVAASKAIFRKIKE